MAETDTSLTPAMFHILLALADRPRHGLGILREIEARTEGDVRLGPGLLYGSIKKLLNAGLVEEPKWRPPIQQDDPRRIYYRITKAGRLSLRAEAVKMQRVLRVAHEKDVLEEPATG